MSNYKKRFPIYAKIIGLYPAKYHREYGDQIIQTTADMLDNADSRKSRLLIWLKIAFDLPINISKQHIEYAGASYSKSAPHYIKRNSLISGLLLLPFFSALIANGLDKLINNHSLYGSWLWRFPALGLWVLYLPEAAFIIAITSYLFYVGRDTRRKNLKIFKRAIDLKRFWPIILPAFASFGILFIVAFHDSVQCFVKTPTYLVTHVSKTWQCSVKNQSLVGFKKYL